MKKEFLPNEAMVALVMEARNGSEAAKNELYKETKGLLLRTVSDFYYSDSMLTKEDLEQEGVLGLLYAIQHYDVDKGAKFSSYAKNCIRYQMLNALNLMGYTCTVSGTVGVQISKITRFEEKYYKKWGQTPDVGTIADALEISEKEVVEAKLYARQHICLDEENEDEQGEMNAMERVSYAVYAYDESPEAASINEDRKNKITEAIEKLSREEKMFALMRYGWGGYEETSMTEIGQALGMSRQNVKKLRIEVERHLGLLLQDYRENSFAA